MQLAFKPQNNSLLHYHVKQYILTYQAEEQMSAKSATSEFCWWCADIHRDSLFQKRYGYSMACFNIHALSHPLGSLTITIISQILCLHLHVPHRSSTYSTRQVIVSNTAAINLLIAHLACKLAWKYWQKPPLRH